MYTVVLALALQALLAVLTHRKYRCFLFPRRIHGGHTSSDADSRSALKKSSLFTAARKPRAASRQTSCPHNSLVFFSHPRLRVPNDNFRFSDSDVCYMPGQSYRYLFDRTDITVKAVLYLQTDPPTTAYKRSS